MISLPPVFPAVPGLRRVLLSLGLGDKSQVLPEHLAVEGGTVGGDGRLQVPRTLRLLRLHPLFSKHLLPILVSPVAPASQQVGGQGTLTF